MTISPRTLKPIKFKNPNSLILRDLSNSAVILDQARSEAEEILESAKLHRETAYLEGKNAGNSEGIGEALTRILRFDRLVSEALNSLSNDLIHIIEQIISDLFAEKEKSVFFRNEIKNRVLRALDTLTKENINYSDIIIVKVPIGSRIEITETLRTIIPETSIVESELCGESNIIFETRFGNIESLPKEHFKLIMEQIKDSIQSNSTIKKIAHDTCLRMVNE